jgi:hypothetical protein
MNSTLIKEFSFGKYRLAINERTNFSKYPNHPYVVNVTQHTPKAKYFSEKVLGNYVFLTIDKAVEYCENYIQKVKATHEAAETRKIAKRHANALVKASDYYQVGDVIVNTWGYEQTNVEFYHVVKVGNKTIEIVQVRASEVEGSMYSHGMACELIPTNEPLIGGRVYTLRVKDKGYLSNPQSYYYFHKWSGRPQYCSWYY